MSSLARPVLCKRRTYSRSFAPPPGMSHRSNERSMGGVPRARILLSQTLNPGG